MIKRAIHLLYARKNKMTFNDETTRRKVIRGIFQIFLTVALFLILYLAYSHFASAVPTIKPYVNDFAGVLSSSQIQTLNEFLSQLEGDTTYEIAVVITKDTEGQDANSYATAIGNENGVGQEGKENGIVVLVATESRDIYIAVGRGAESIIADAEAGRIGRDNAKIYFPNGQYYEGIYQIVEDLSTEIRKPSNAVPLTALDGNLDGANTPDNVSLNVFWGIIISIIILFTFSVVWGVFRRLGEPEPEPKHYGKRKVYDDDEDDSSSPYVPVILPSSSGGFSSGSSGGGGFGSFGGGSFGGGGGGGKW
jgi:uncharacterized protein